MVVKERIDITQTIQNIVSTEEMVEDAIKKNPRCVENTILTEGTVLYGK